jgi:hypothetical protein
MSQIVGLIIVLLAFGGAFAASVLVERVLRRNMSNFVRGIFTFVVGYLALQALLLISFMTCGLFGGECL